MAKVGSKRHISTAKKLTAGMIDFKGIYFSGSVWSNDGETPAIYSSQKVAEKMAEKRSLVAVLGRNYWYLASK